MISIDLKVFCVSTVLFTFLYQLNEKKNQNEKNLRRKKTENQKKQDETQKKAKK